jgi:hypothetical protein
VIELRHGFGHHERMMIGQRFHPGAQPDVLRALRRGGNKDFRRSDDFKAAGMMLANPRFVEAEPVQERHELQIAFQRVSGIEIGGMERPHEHAKTQRMAGRYAASGFVHATRPSPFRHFTGADQKPRSVLAPITDAGCRVFMRTRPTGRRASARAIPPSDMNPPVGRISSAWL